MSDKEKNNNLGDVQAEHSADQSNMPDNQVPRHRSNDNNEENKVVSEAGFLSREGGRGDFGSEEARSDADKGNSGNAGNMPNTAQDKPEENNS